MGAGTETGSSRNSLTAAGEGMRPVRNDGRSRVPADDTKEQIGLIDVDSHNFPNIPLMKFYETIARIISEREQVKVTVQVREKEAAA